MKITILSENRTNHPECMAEHGLSVLIETGGRRLLFDLGASELCLQNAEHMGADLEQVDTVVISHGHYDHTGGAPSFCMLNQRAKIYIHETAFSETYGIEKGKLESAPCSIRWTKGQLEEIRPRLVLTKGAVWITEDILASGTIPRGEDFVPTETFYIKREGGSLSADPMDHEQFLAIRERDENGKSKGVFLFSGCSHNGVIPCLAYAKALFPGERIAFLLAGMHLYHSTAEQRKEVLGQLVSEGIPYVLPVHCTGIQGICDLRQLMGEGCIPAGAGDSFVF